MDWIKKNPYLVAGGAVIVIGLGVWWYRSRQEAFLRDRFEKLHGKAKKLIERGRQIDRADVNKTLWKLVRTANDLSDRGVVVLDRGVESLDPKYREAIGRNFAANKGRGGGLFGTLSGQNGGIFAKIKKVFS
jgi:hypothetical protein